MQPAVGAINFADAIARYIVGLRSGALLNRLEGESGGKSGCQRATDGSIDMPTVIGSVSGFNLHISDVRRLAANDIDGSGRGIAAVKIPLRSLENLDPIDIEESKRQHGGRYQIDIVDIHPCSRIVVCCIVIQANPANTDIDNAVGQHILDLHIGRDRRQVDDRLRAGSFQVASGQNVDCYTDIISALFAPLGSDDYFSQTIVRHNCFRLTGGRILGKCRRGTSQTTDRDGKTAGGTDVIPGHDILPPIY